MVVWNNVSPFDHGVGNEGISSFEIFCVYLVSPWSSVDPDYVL